MKVGAIIQARMSSHRLPGKVLKNLPWHGETVVLQHVIRRCKAAQKVTQVLVATSTLTEDDPIVALAEKESVPCFRGPLHDVLQRFAAASQEFGLDIVVRITSDCPCIDPCIIDRAIMLWEKYQDHFVSTVSPGYFPRGMDVAVFSSRLLYMADRQASTDFEREHVTPWIKNQLHHRHLILKASEEERIKDIRLTLDTKEDYALMCEIFSVCYEKNPLFGISEIARLIEDKPWLLLINQSVPQKNLKLSKEDEYQRVRELLLQHQYVRAAEIIKYAYDQFYDE